VPTLQANGISVAYEAVGAGPPLVMLHGATSSGRADFAAQIPLFSKAFRLYLPDARGHGASGWEPERGLSLDLLVDDVAAFVDHLGLGTFHLLGFSMGGMTALAYAVRHPERLRTLVLVGISPEREPRASLARRLMDPDRIQREDPAWAAELARRHDGTHGPGGWQRLLAAIARDVVEQPLLSPADLRRVSCPTLVACGDRDPWVPVGQAWSLMRQLPDARLLVVPDAGHEVMAQRPGVFNEACGLFYRLTEPVARRRAGVAR
jgi:pimeloyl-ACP methyl ester carboxylesterase